MPFILLRDMSYELAILGHVLFTLHKESIIKRESTHSHTWAVVRHLCSLCCGQEAETCLCAAIHQIKEKKHNFCKKYYHSYKTTAKILKCRKDGGIAIAGTCKRPLLTCISWIFSKDANELHRTAVDGKIGPMSLGSA